MERLSEKDFSPGMASESNSHPLIAFLQKTQLKDHARKFLIQLSALLPKTQRIFYLGYEDEDL